MQPTRRKLLDYFARMEAHFGPTHWWPGETPFEIAIGAILTQNTAWTNVERAIAGLKARELLTADALIAAPLEVVEQAIRPSGYFRQKAVRIRNFSAHLLVHYAGRIEGMATRPLQELRAELLELKGIGPETADDILLYAVGQPVFVVDAYTRRIFSRHGLVPGSIKYEALRAVFERALPHEVPLFREYHGLIVYTGKDFCRKTPACAGCPLRALLPGGVPCAD
ncbi:MAG: endonuclease III domain-containing protein [Candidatus Hydrogenedentes bacterium]|nr:endonuclease III domain-containing protein [Candidatus Hydrogenedentota bacterium]